jgi:cytidylate kinase
MNNNLNPKLITLDGPVAAGKSSVGLLLAKKLGYLFFDTGVMYRAFTWKALNLGIPSEDENKLFQLAGITRFDFIPRKEGQFSLLLDGNDVSNKLNCPEVEEKVSLISKIARVRRAMVAAQRKLAQQGKIIMAGRDIGTVVLPQAELKIFLTASIKERALRRYKELSPKGGKISYDLTLSDIQKRDEADCNRAISPLKPAADAIIIDTENLTLEQVVDKIYALAVKQ